jgi:hypothetical protein
MRPTNRKAASTIPRVVVVTEGSEYGWDAIGDTDP